MQDQGLDVQSERSKVSNCVLFCFLTETLCFYFLLFSLLIAVGLVVYRGGSRQG